MRYVTITAAVLIIAAPSAYAAEHAGRPASADQQFVDQAANINLLEIDAAHQAEQKAADPAYKDYAKMIITDHTNMADDLKNQVASMPNVTIPSGLDSEHRQKLQELKSLSGAAFERQYRESQIKGHEAAIKIFTDYAGTGSDDKEAGLKSWAKASVPILEKHLQRAENLPQPKGPSVAAAPGNSSDLAATGSRSMTTGAAPTGDSNGGAGQALVNESVGVIKKMEADNKLAQLVKTAKGLYIVPEFGRGALVVGARGGAGLLTVHENGKWSDPAFYDLGGISVGPQVGGSGGAVVFVLMNQKAVDAFRRSDSFSLNAGAGISIANYSDNSQESWGKSDIVLWSDTAGAYIGATISVTDITSNREDDRNYYGKNVDLTNILNGSVTNANAAELTTVLPE